MSHIGGTRGIHCFLLAPLCRKGIPVCRFCGLRPLGFGVLGIGVGVFGFRFVLLKVLLHFEQDNFSIVNVSRGVGVRRIQVSLEI